MLRGFSHRKNVEFFEDRELEERFRSKLSDFRGSGYDRGHLVSLLQNGPLSIESEVDCYAK